MENARSTINVCVHTTSSEDRRVLRVASTLVEAGCIVTLIVMMNESSSSPEEKIEGIQHRIVQSPSIGRMLSRLQAPVDWLFSMKCLLQVPADLYHASSLNALPACYIAATLRRKPLVFETYEPPFADLATSGECKFWLHRLSACLLRGVLRQCAGVIAASPLAVQTYRRRYSLPDVVLLRDLPGYRPEYRSERLRLRLGLSAETRIALYVGALRPEHEVEQLVCAAAFLERNIVLVILKRGSCESIAQIEQQIEREGVAEKVKLLEPVPDDELLDWISSADLGLLVLPLTYLPGAALVQPGILFEYLMAGLPVLTSQLEAIAEIVENYAVGGVVAALTPQNIGAAINTLLEDAETLADMRDNALSAASEFCWERERQKLVTLYRDILSERYI